MNYLKKNNVITLQKIIGPVLLWSTLTRTGLTDEEETKYETNQSLQERILVIKSTRSRSSSLGFGGVSLCSSSTALKTATKVLNKEDLDLSPKPTPEKAYPIISLEIKVPLEGFRW